MSPLPSTPVQPFLATGAAARRCGLSRHTLLRAARRGDLPIAWRTPGGDLRFRGADVDTFASRLARSTPAGDTLAPAGRQRIHDRVRSFGRFVACSPDLLCVTSPDGYFVWVNPAFTAILGWSTAELLASPYTDFLHPDDRDCTAAAEAAVRQGKPMPPFENRYRCTDGSWRLISWTGISQAQEEEHYLIGRDITDRRQLEEVQHANEALFRSMFEDVGIGMSMVGIDGRLQRVNAAFCALVGYTEAELAHSAWPALTHPDDLDASLALVQRLVHSQSRFASIEKRYIHKRGHTLWVLLSTTLVRNAAGQPRHFISQTQDITARKEAEAAQAQLAALVEASRDAIFGKTLDGRITSWNHGAEHLYGYTAAEAVGQPITLLAPPDRQTEIATLMAQVARGESIAEYETERRRKDGTTVPIALTISPVRGGDGAVTGAAVVARDRSARREAEAVRGQLAAIVDQSSDAIVGMTPDQVITSWNAGAERLYGYEAAEVIGHSIAVLSVPDRTAELTRIRQDTLADQHLNDLDTVRRHKNGSIIPVSITVSSIRDASGAVIGFAGIARDISVRKTLEEHLRTLSQAVEQSPVSVVITDAGGAIEYVNRHFRELTGYANEEVVGLELADPAVWAHPAGHLYHVVEDAPCRRGLVWHLREQEEKRRTVLGASVDFCQLLPIKRPLLIM